MTDASKTSARRKTRRSQVTRRIDVLYYQVLVKDRDEQ